MSKPIKSDTDASVIKLVLPPPGKYEIKRRERHAVTEAVSSARRKAKNAPRREDVARAGLFIILMQYRGSKHDAARAKVRNSLLDLLVDAGFSREEAARVFDDLVGGFGPDLDRWLMLRGIRFEDEIRQKWRSRVKAVLSAADKE